MAVHQIVGPGRLNQEINMSKHPQVSEPDHISMRTSFDRNLIWERGDSVRYLVAELTAPKLELETQSRHSLNLAMVIDASASMSGPPLEAAKEAAIGLVRCLSGDDYLSIISFSSNVIVEIESVRLSRENRERAIAAIQSLETRSNTNLSAGWLRGVEAITETARALDKSHNHVIILSDGYANEGMCSAIELAHHAQQLLKQGVITSCVGIGNGYSPDQLQALADHGGGQLHDAEYPGEITEVVLGELNEIRNCVVSNIEITLEFPREVKIECISNYPMSLTAGQCTASLGMLISEGTRDVVFKITSPPGVPEEELVFETSCSWIKTGESKRTHCPNLKNRLTFASSEENLRQARDIELSMRVARVWQAAIVRHAVTLNRLGDLRKLEKYLADEQYYFSRYCNDLPAAQLIDELAQLKAEANRMWDERARKDMHYSHYSVQHGKADYIKRRDGEDWLRRFKQQ